MDNEYLIQNGKIALIDADLLDKGTRHPNLVIMKLSNYFKLNNNCSVKLIEDYEEIVNNNYAGIKDYDAIFISKVFDFTKIDTHILDFNNVFYGGTGFFFDKAPPLPEVVEHFRPDYHIYDDYIEHNPHEEKKTYWKDYKDFSIGFATRGCFRKCSFCVNRKYSKVCFHSHINEWLDPERPYIYLWDDNILGFSHWKDVLEELIEVNKPFQFKQGMDIRLMTAEKAQILNKCKYYGDYIFAFDHIEDKGLIEEKLALWRQYSKKSTKLYVLSGYAGIDEKEIESVLERIRVLMNYGCLPYIMRHENYLKSEYKTLFTSIARWCNQPAFFKMKSFREFCDLCQKDKKKPGLCSAKKALTDFENKFPDIAKKYFDLKFINTEYYKKEHEDKQLELF